MQIKCKSLKKQVSSAISLVITNRPSKKKCRNGWNLIEINECLLAVGSRKRKKWFPLPSYYHMNR